MHHLEFARQTDSGRKRWVRFAPDVDEAVLLSDRVLMSSHGPAAISGEIFLIDLARPGEFLAFARCASAQNTALQGPSLDFGCGLHPFHARFWCSAPSTCKDALGDYITNCT